MICSNGSWVARPRSIRLFDTQGGGEARRGSLHLALGCDVQPLRGRSATPRSRHPSTKLCQENKHSRVFYTEQTESKSNSSFSVSSVFHCYQLSSFILSILLIQLSRHSSVWVPTANCVVALRSCSITRNRVAAKHLQVTIRCHYRDCVVR
jgi:hypothetical protein